MSPPPDIDHYVARAKGCFLLVCALLGLTGCGVIVAFGLGWEG